MTFGHHCAELICGKYKLPADFPAAIAGIIDREIKVYAQNEASDGKKVPPSIPDLRAYIQEIGATNFTAEAFFAHYESNGWMVGKTKMKNWRAACQTWKLKEQNRPAIMAKYLAAGMMTEWERKQKAERLTGLRNEAMDLKYPGGSATSVDLKGEKLERFKRIQDQIKQLRKELDE